MARATVTRGGSHEGATETLVWQGGVANTPAVELQGPVPSEDEEFAGKLPKAGPSPYAVEELTLISKTSSVLTPCYIIFSLLIFWC
jgi:hypothetical protein